MNCTTVREMLAAIRPDSRDADQPEFASEMMHLEQCAECRAFFDAQQRTDRELGRAVRDVSVPVDLKARLLAQVAAASSPAATSVSTPLATTIAAEPAIRPHSARRSWNRRQVLTTVSAALLLTVFGSWWFLHANRNPTLSVNELVILSHGPLSTTKFQGSFRPELPVNEIRMPLGLKGAPAYSLQYLGREIGASIPYKVPLTRGNPLSVILVIIDLQKVLVPDLKSVGKSFQTATVAYPKPNSYATRIWQGKQYLYVCYVLSRNAEDIEKLKNQSSTT